MLYGGPQATIFALIVACFVQWLIALGLSEQASAFPSSGGTFCGILSLPSVISWLGSLTALDTRAVPLHLHPRAREAQEHCGVLCWNTQCYRLVGHHLLRNLEQCAVHHRHDRFRRSGLHSSEMAHVPDVPGADIHNTYVDVSTWSIFPDAPFILIRKSRVFTNSMSWKLSPYLPSRSAISASGHKCASFYPYSASWSSQW